MRFGVLGPLAVWTTDGRPIVIPELKIRLLLASLLTHDVGAVAFERLVDDLWGDSPPRDPDAVLRSKVSQLRRVLEDAEPGGRDLVVRDRSGYLLKVAPSHVDAGAFAALVEAARASADLRVRERLLAEALRLWRGSPLADVADHEFLWSAAARLDEERLAAVEEHLATLLSLGEHSAVVGPAAGLLVDHPLREGLRALHMRALYRCGRQTEALDSYEGLRNRLVEERGLSPGPALAALHLAILSQDPELDAKPIPARAPHRPPSALPAPATPLVGRGGVVDSVRAALERERLVTLVGAGGVGKTRLAVAVAMHAAEAPAATGALDGIWLVELAGLTDTATDGDVGAAVAQVMNVHETHHAGTAGPGDRPEDRVVRALAARDVLLVLDNCDHVIEPVARLTDRLLKEAPNLRVLATSREPLRVPGEVVWAVPPLDLPDPDLTGDPDAVAGSGAGQLFLARARAASPGFVLDAGTAPWVAAICQRLDGLPLALELAATRVGALGVRELATRLDDSFRILGPGDRVAPPRHRTLRAVIDWSWDRLSPSEQAVLRRLSLAAGGYDVAAAEEVCSAPGIDAADVLELVAALVDRSLVVMVEGADGPRYRLLETVAAYASDRLDDVGERGRAQERHDSYFLDVAERAAVGLKGRDQRCWLERLDAESHNIRRALQGAERRGDAELALRLANAMTSYWYLRGRFTEARQTLDGILAWAGNGSSRARAEASAIRAGFAWLVGDDRLTGGFRDAVATSGDSPTVSQATAEWFLAFSLCVSGDGSVVVELTEAALARFTRLGDRWGVAACLSVRAAHELIVTGDLVAARRDADASLATFRELEDEWGQLTALQTLDVLAEIAGDYPRAAALAAEQCDIAERLGLPTEMSYGLSRRGRVALLTGDGDSAQAFHQRARRVAREQGNRMTEEVAEIGLALGARRAGELDAAEAYLGRWIDGHRSGPNALGLALYLTELGFVAELRGDVERATRHHVEGHVAARATGEPRTIARSLEGLAGVLSLTPGREQDAGQLLAAAAELRASVGSPLPPAESIDVDRIAARLRRSPPRANP